MTYDERVRAYEAEGMTRSDAQGIVDLEDLRAAKRGDAMSTHTPERLRCEVCDMPTLGDTLCNLHYEEQEAMSTHTPGPWKVAYSTNFPDQQTIQAVGSDRILALIDRNDEQDTANAALIAAAPAMLEALKDLLDYAVDPAQFTRQNVVAFIDKGTEAIRLAEGRP